MVNMKKIKQKNNKKNYFLSRIMHGKVIFSFSSPQTKNKHKNIEYKEKPVTKSLFLEKIKIDESNEKVMETT